MRPSPSLLARHAPLAPVNECPELLAHQAGDIFGLWQAWEVECKAVRDVPYWAIVWPAARVLAQYLFDHPTLVRGRRVLDCGCGSGAAAIASALNDALTATGCDLDPTAISVGEINAAANRVPVTFLCRDVIEVCGQGFDLILVADLFYQRELTEGLLAVLKAARREGVEVLIADSGRPFLPREGVIEIHVQSAATSFDVEGCRSREVRLYRLP